jgi:hypothetical protein
MFEIGGVVAILIATVAFIGGADQNEGIPNRVSAHAFTLYDRNKQVRANLGYDARSRTTKLVIFGEDGGLIQIGMQLSAPEVIFRPRGGKRHFYFAIGADGKPIIRYSDDNGGHDINLPQGEVTGKPPAENEGN